MTKSSYKNKNEMFTFKIFLTIPQPREAKKDSFLLIYHSKWEEI